MSSGMPQSRPASPDVDGAIFQLQHEFASHEMAVIERSDRILPSSASVPHGKFTATTATFCWPSLKPFSQLNEPNMYRIQSTPSFLATPWPPLSSDTSPALSSRSTTSSASKQSHSEYDHDVDDNNFVSENMSPEELPIVRTRKELFDDQNAPDMGRTATAYSPSEKEAAHERSPPSQTHPSLSRSESVALRHASSNFRPEPQSSGSSEGEYMDWEIYTRHVERDYFCTWGGCNYQAKKQLVKRHIQTTHMKLKPFPCRYCGGRFPQKTSLNVHVASKHTRDNPYKCPFGGCTRAFNDPARLHRHKTDVHHYLPKSIVRCNNRGPNVSEERPVCIGPFSTMVPTESQ